MRSLRYTLGVHSGWLMLPNLAQVVVAVARKGAGGAQLLGTAFAVGPTKFATAAHTISQTDKDLALVFGRVTSLFDYQDTTNSQVNLCDVTIAAFDPIRDIAVLDTGAGAQCQCSYTLDGADRVPPGSPIVTLGYPHANHGRLVLTQQTSTVGARIILGSSGIKTKHIVLNTQARPGQSGSPVFANNGAIVCGMLIGSYAPGGGGGISLGGVDPHTLHQTTHAISAEYIASML